MGIALPVYPPAPLCRNVPAPCRYNGKRKAIWTGVWDGLQNRSAAVEVAGVFDSHCLPPNFLFIFNNLEYKMAHVQNPRTRNVYSGVMKLTAYRRHLGNCEHRVKGQSYTLCACPIWAYGHKLRRSLGTNNWERALSRLAILEAGGDPDGSLTSGITLTAATDAFLADGAARGLTKSTLDLYVYLFAHLAAFCGAVSLAAIDVTMLDRFRQSRTRPTAGGDPVPIQPATQRKEIGFLRAFFHWCVERKWIEDNPARRVRMPKETAPGTLPYDADEVRRMIAACDQITSDDPAEVSYIRHRARALVYGLLYSGLRISDVAKLRRPALDVSTGHLTIRRIQKTGVSLKVLIHQNAVKALNTLPAVNPEYFFWTGQGSLTTLRKNLARTVARLGKLAGVRATPHRFRDTFAVELLTQGADIRTVQMLLGHESVRTTEKHYARFVKAHQELLDRATATLDFEREPGRPLLVKPLKRTRRNA